MSTESKLLPTLRAAIDRIIPADDFPSASHADVDRFIVGLLAGDRQIDAASFSIGLASLVMALAYRVGRPITQNP